MDKFVTVGVSLSDYRYADSSFSLFVRGIRSDVSVFIDDSHACMK
jgi:hypothetical protein